MRTAVLVSALIALAACGTDRPDEPAAPDEPVADEAPAEPTAEARLSGDVLGTYDATAEACAEITTMGRLTVTPDSLRFYYGYALVDSVVARDGRAEVGATLYHLEGAVEVVPEPQTYRLEPTGDGLVFDAVGGQVPPQELVRCPSE